MGRSAIVKDPVDVLSELAGVLSSSNRIGGTVTFLGTVRETSEHGKVVEIYYECYEEVAERELESIRTEAIERFGLIDATVVHRVGTVKLGEVSLLVVASGEHRKEAFEAASWIVDEVKRRVPIWKKEVYTDGSSRWLEGSGLIRE